MQVYVPLARPIYIAFGLVSVSTHWNNFLWPLIVTNSVQSRPLTVGLQVFSSTDQGGLVHHHGGYADDLGAAAAGVPAVPAAVRAVVHAGGDTLNPQGFSGPRFPKSRYARLAWS
jgi:ABC-type glycerol-3-phosphate transport system permease component